MHWILFSLVVTLHSYTHLKPRSNQNYFGRGVTLIEKKNTLYVNLKCHDGTALKILFDESFDGCSS